MCAGEGPVWNAASQTLFWVDILDNKIYGIKQGTDVLQYWDTSEHCGFVICGAEKSVFAGYKSGLHELQLMDNNSVSARRIDRIDTDQPSVRLNDGMKDQNGGIWACSMDMDNNRNLGKYFYYDSSLKRKIVREGFVVANGPALSPDEQTLYTVETVGNKNIAKGIYSSQVLSLGIIADSELLINWLNLPSFPDGICVDHLGNIWVGEFGGNILRCFSCKGRLLREINLPAWNVTKCAFGGAAMDLLFVTSASLDVDSATIANFKFTGATLCIEGIL